MTETAATRPPTLEELRARRDEILELAAKRGARNVGIFGSVARGDAARDSDVDFIVEMEPGRSLLDLGGLLMDLELLLDRPVGVVTYRGLAPRARARILAETQEL